MLNFNNVGSNICEVNNGKYNKKIISVSTEDEPNGFDYFKLTDDGKFEMAFDGDKERIVAYYFGAAGSGKSYNVSKLLKKYKKKNKKNPIILFSDKNEDEQLDEIGLDRIIIDESLCNDPIDINELQNTMLVFDDVDSISDKKIRKSVFDLMNKALLVGRSKGISVIMTNHCCSNRDETKKILNETMYITWYPNSGSYNQILYLLSNYCGLDKKLIEKCRQSRSRWCVLVKNYPQVIFTEKECFLACSDDKI